MLSQQVEEQGASLSQEGGLRGRPCSGPRDMRHQVTGWGGERGWALIRTRGCLPAGQGTRCGQDRNICAHRQASWLLSGRIWLWATIRPPRVWHMP